MMLSNCAMKLAHCAINLKSCIAIQPETETKDKLRCNQDSRQYNMTKAWAQYAISDVLTGGFSEFDEINQQFNFYVIK